MARNQRIKCSEGAADENGTGKFYGVIQQLPQDLQNGDWIVSGETFVVSPTTHLKSEGLAFTVGVTVEVDRLDSNNIKYAREIKIQPGHHGGPNENEFYGLIQQLPQDLQSGNWVISGQTFVVSPTTELKSEGFTFAVGVPVKVHYRTDINNVNYAKEIQDPEQWSRARSRSRGR